VVAVVPMVVAARSSLAVRTDRAGRRCGVLVCQADQIDMGWFARTAEADMGKALTEAERLALGKLESAVEAGVNATLSVIAAGKALAEIRERQLYRASGSSWEDYVHTRFRLSKRRADQMIAFAGVTDALDELRDESGTTVPDLSERAARPLAGMDAETIKAVVAEAAAGGEITPASIRKAAGRRKAKAARVPRPRRFKVPGAVVIVTFNRKSNGSAIDALAAAHRQAEEELADQAEAAA
jgi:hypothetical protein